MSYMNLIARTIARTLTARAIKPVRRPNPLKFMPFLDQVIPGEPLPNIVESLFIKPITTSKTIISPPILTKALSRLASSTKLENTTIAATRIPMAPTKFKSAFVL